MKQYDYRALSSENEAVEGVLEAENLQHARELLMLRGLREAEVRPKREPKDSSLSLLALAEHASRRAAGPEKLAPEMFKAPAVVRLRPSDAWLDQAMVIFRGHAICTPTEKALWIRQWAAMFSAGLGIVPSLEVLAQGGSAAAGRAFHQAADEVSRGTVPSLALLQLGLLNERESAVIAAAERSGQLERVLNNLADQVEKGLSFRKRVQAALVHPGLVMLLLWLGLPILARAAGNVAQSFNQSAPWTRLLCSPLWLVTCWGSLPVTLLILYTQLGRLPVERRLAFLRRVPGVRGVVAQVEQALVVRTLSHLLAAGIPMLDALLVCARVALGPELGVVRTRVAQGETLRTAFAGVVSPLTLAMLEVGESTGQLDGMLLRAASIQEEDSATRIELAVQLIEPLLLLFVGALVGTFCLLTLSPLIQAVQNL